MFSRLVKCGPPVILKYVKSILHYTRASRCEIIKKIARCLNARCAFIWAILMRNLHSPTTHCRYTTGGPAKLRLK